MKKELGELFLSTGAGVRVAVLDSGVNPVLPLLRGRDFDVFDCQVGEGGLVVRKLAPGLSSDRNGHGGVVHSCVFAVAPDARADHFRILDEANRCDSTLLCYVLDHVIEAGYRVVNLSLGTRSEECVPWLVSIMKRAYERGVVVVASSSNVGNALYPSRFTYAVSVDAQLLALNTDLRFHPGSVIEFGGAGVEILVPGDGRDIVATGSSYAAAHVSGLCARLLESHPEFSPLDVKMALRDHALRLQREAEARVG